MSPIHTLARLLTTIQRFTDDQTDQLQDLLGFGYNPDDAYDALNQLQALRDLPEDAIERVRKYIEAAADFPTVFAKKGVLASIPVIGKDPIELNANDVTRLLRAVGVFKIGAGKIRIGHPTKGVVESTTPAEPGESFADGMATKSTEAREQKYPMQTFDESKEVRASYPGGRMWALNTDGTHNHGDLPPRVTVRPVVPLVDSDDAGRWASEFMTSWRNQPMREDENWLEGAMIGWFANAIETGKRIGEAGALVKAAKAQHEKRARDRKEMDDVLTREDRHEALLIHLGRKDEPLERAVDIIVELQDKLRETVERTNEGLVGFKIVPESAVVFDVEAVAKQAGEVLEKAMRDIQNMKLRSY